MYSINQYGKGLRQFPLHWPNLVLSYTVDVKQCKANAFANPHLSNVRQMRLPNNICQYTVGGRYFCVTEDKNSDDSDIMPGLESNSRIDMIDPETFDTKAMRRAMIRR